MSMSTFLLLKRALLLLSSWPDLLNALSLGTDEVAWFQYDASLSVHLNLKLIQNIYILVCTQSKQQSLCTL